MQPTNEPSYLYQLSKDEILLLLKYKRLNEDQKEEVEKEVDKLSENK